MSDLEPMPAPPGRWGRRIVVAVVVLLLVGGAGAGAGVVWFRSEVDPGGPAGAPVELEVPRGSSTQRIAVLLERAGVVKSARSFRLYVKVRGAGPFQAGRYSLRRRASFDDVIAALEKGPEIAYQRLTVPEGLTLRQVAALVERLPGRSAARFLEVAAAGRVRSRFQPAASTSLEGLLLPETYNFEAKDDEEAILERMVRAFDEAAAEAGIDSVAADGRVDPYQAIVVASLVEREARVSEDRAMVARVVYNRLERKMLLQVDATVVYALGRPGERGVRVLFKDLEIDSPYNTYKRPGLPPTPIASPGRASLRAAVQPAPGPWLYYVVVEADGRHAFATTLAEHNRNIALAASRGLR